MPLPSSPSPRNSAGLMTAGAMQPVLRGPLMSHAAQGPTRCVFVRLCSLIACPRGNRLWWATAPATPALGGSISARGARRASFFLPFPTRACFCPPSPNNLENLLAVSRILAHLLHPVYDDGKGGGWKWWGWHFVLLNSHISAYARCLAGKVCGLVRSTWGTSQGGDKPGTRDKILKTKVARRACAGRAPGKHSPQAKQRPRDRADASTRSASPVHLLWGQHGASDMAPLSEGVDTLGWAVVRYGQAVAGFVGVSSALKTHFAKTLCTVHTGVSTIHPDAICGDSSQRPGGFPVRALYRGRHTATPNVR